MELKCQCTEKIVKKYVFNAELVNVNLSRDLRFLINILQRKNFNSLGNGIYMDTNLFTLLIIGKFYCQR